ncbi:MAG: HAD hydrolase-like protein [Eubacterium sp.]|nr:HAD hydrolase-like protein [Eubacterium sp.]
MKKAVIFDFDGTICDTGKGIKVSARYALESYGIPCENENELDFFIGPPLLDTFMEHYDQNEDTARGLVEKYREHYAVKGLFESELYDGIKELLISLKDDKIKIGIASSKPALYVEKLLEKFDILKYFDAVCGVDFKSDRETKKSIISRCINALGVKCDEACVVGDRSYDIIGAKENGAQSVGVLWGYGSYGEFKECGADLIAEKPDDIEAVALGMYEETTDNNILYDGRILKFHNDTVKLCNGESAKRETVNHPGGVAVIGITDDGRVPLVRQFRYPYKEVIFEIPAGKVEPGEDPFITGQREFKEECGALADEYFPLGEMYPSPGYTDEIIRLYGARGIRFEEQELDEDEFLEVYKMPLEELIKRIMSGEIKDGKTIIAALKLKEKITNDLS